MPCTWIGYGEPFPRLPINTREKKKRRKDFFWRKEGSKLEKKKKRESKNRRGEGKTKTTVSTQRRRRIVLTSWAPPLFFPIHHQQQHREQPPTELGKERVEDWCMREKKGKKNRIQGMKKTDNSEKNNNLSLRPLSSPSGTTGRRAILLLGRHQRHCLRPPQRGKNIVDRTNEKQRKKKHQSRGEKKKNHRLPSQPSIATTATSRPAPRATNAARSVSFSYFFSGRSPLFTGPFLSGPVQKKSKIF